MEERAYQFLDESKDRGLKEKEGVVEVSSSVRFPPLCFEPETRKESSR